MEDDYDTIAALKDVENVIRILYPEGFRAGMIAQNSDMVTTQLVTEIVDPSSFPFEAIDANPILTQRIKLRPGLGLNRELVEVIIESRPSSFPDLLPVKGDEGPLIPDDAYAFICGTPIYLLDELPKRFAIYVDRYNDLYSYDLTGLLY